jgi:hypothetical protein
MNKVFYPLFTLFLAYVTPQSLAQEALPDRIQSYFNAYQDSFPVEKAYLHLDKFTYTLGEDLWFSAYLVAGGTQVPSPLSKTLYVDFFDGDGLLLTQKMIKIEGGRGAGDFKIPNFGKTGVYQIKAYTSWMKNFGEEYFFSQSFQVVDGQGGSFLPKVEFLEVKSQEAKVRYQLSLQAVNSSGEPLNNKLIGLRAIAGDQLLYEQEIQLNAQGSAEFGFSIPESNHPSQSLELSFQESENYLVTQKIKLPYSLEAADIQFLPEGGNWLIGKKAKLAFRAVYPDGTPVALTGSIENSPETGFTSNFAGLGKVEFTPQTEGNFALVKSTAYGEERRIPLPLAGNSGLSIQVQNVAEAAFVTAFVQGNEPNEELLLVSHTRGLINFMIQGKLTNGVWGVRIPKKNLPSGINTIAVLDKSGKPLLERLVFIQNEDFLKLDLTTSSPVTSRGKMEFSLQSTFRDTLATGSFSVAILDAEQVNDESEVYGTIISHLLLNSDLKGSIYRSGYYFRNQNETTRADLDLVMLTHGWSRFTWEDVTQSKYPDQGHYIEQGITIQGMVSEQTPTKKGLGGGRVNAILGEGIELISTEYGPDGKFILTDLSYEDSVTVTLTAEDIRLKNFIDLKVQEPSPVFKNLNGKFQPQIAWPEGLISTFGERNLMQQLTADTKITDLEGVTVQANTLQEEQTTNRKIYGEGDATLKPDEIPGSVGFTNIFQLIQGRVAGVRVTFDGFNARVQIRGAGSIQAGTEPLYLLDNVPVDAGTLAQINPNAVESIDVFKDPARTAIFGAQGGNGVIAVYLKTGAGLTYQSVGGTLVTRYGGYAIAREFYSPKYEENNNTAISDKRATLYWNPLVTIDGSGQAKVEFYNSDSARKYLIVVEGIDPLGRLGHLVKFVE